MAIFFFLTAVLIAFEIFHQLKGIKKRMATQEEQLQEVLGLLTNTIAPGLTEIIKRLNSIPVPTDNPAIQDEIDGVRDAARAMAEEISATLNPPPPEG